MNETQAIDLLSVALKRRHGKKIDEFLEKMLRVQADTQEAEDAFISAMVAEVLQNPPSCFHSRTGGRYAQIAKTNAKQHREFRAAMTRGYR